MQEESDKKIEPSLNFLRLAWWALLPLIVILILLCHVFADWARWFPVVTEPEFVRFWIGKPVIVILNLFLILSIIALFRISNMKTMWRYVKKRNMIINAESLDAYTLRHIYARSVILSIVIGLLMAACGVVGFFLTRDYFILYLFVSMSCTFLLINHPGTMDIEKLKNDLKDSKSVDASMPEKKRIKRKKICFVLLMILIFPVTCTYLEYRNIDPEGACKGFSDVGICMYALYYSEHFHPLPTDSEMIEHFRKYRQEFESMAKDVNKIERAYPHSFGESKKKSLEYQYSKLNVRTFSIFSYLPSDIYSDQEECKEGLTEFYSGNIDKPSIAFAFEIERTIYIQGADFSFPHNSHEKGYVYFPIVPKIENGRVIGRKIKDGSRDTWRLNNHLDRKWPKDMERGEYILRQIEPQWFLYISNNHIGG